MTLECAKKAYAENSSMFRAGVRIRIDHYVRAGHSPNEAFCKAVADEKAGHKLP